MRTRSTVSVMEKDRQENSDLGVTFLIEIYKTIQGKQY